MKWVVLIRVRSSVDGLETTTNAMSDIIADLQMTGKTVPALVGVSQYLHKSIQTDATLALEFEAPEFTEAGQGLTNQLMAALNEFGMVDQGTWISTNSVHWTDN